MQLYLAHIRNDDEEQTLRAHCRNAAQYASASLAPLGLSKTAYLAALLHDLGKAKEEFLAYLKAASADPDTVRRGSINHTFSGVRFILERWHSGSELGYHEIVAELLAYGVGAHHGLFDCVDPLQVSGFEHRLTRQNIGYDESLAIFLKECASPSELDELFRSAAEECIPLLEKLSGLSAQPDNYEADCETFFYVGLLARMLSSAVMEGDRRDTAEFMSKAVFPAWPEDMRPIWCDRLHFMEEKLQAFSHDSPLNQARQIISDQCAAFAAQPGGIYHLNVPTGSGKTLSSLRYALTHAMRRNRSRIIFTSPLLSILDQNALIVRDYIGDDTLILEHHSNLAEPEGTPEHLSMLDLMTDTWESPIIITTLVQLLNTCFSGKTGAIRRFHSLCNSIIVIDEVQTVPSKLLTLFNLAINFLSQICGATVVLCSATQPCLDAVHHPLWCTPKDIVPYQPALWNIFKRTEILNAGAQRLCELPQTITDTMSVCHSLLVVCNTKAEAAFLFHQTQSTSYQSFHLSAAMCVKHRRDTISAVQSALARSKLDGSKVLCISTQVIEAGVDISFQQVIRLSAGMDSVIQSAGRCNRHAESPTPAPVRIIRCSDESLRCLEDISRGKQATSSLLTAFSDHPERFQHDLSSVPSISHYYRKLYSEMTADFQDDIVPEHGSIYHLLSDNCKYADQNCPAADRFFLRQAFHLAGTLFQVFDEDTTELLVPFEEGRTLRERLIAADRGYGTRDWNAIHSCIEEAKQYSVSLYRYQLDRLNQQGAITSLFNGQILVLSDGFYDNSTGFHIENGTTEFQEV